MPSSSCLEVLCYCPREFDPTPFSVERDVGEGVREGVMGCYLGEDVTGSAR